MMKEVLTLLALLCMAQSAHAYQAQLWQMQQQSGAKSKIYSSTGALMGYAEPKSNNTVRYFNKYHQYTGYTRQAGNRVKYYSK